MYAENKDPTPAGSLREDQLSQTETSKPILGMSGIGTKTSTPTWCWRILLYLSGRTLGDSYTARKQTCTDMDLRAPLQYPPVPLGG